MPARAQLPSAWTAFRQQSDDSHPSPPFFDEERLQPHHDVSDDTLHPPDPSASQLDLRRRRSSVAIAVDRLRQAGGVNSFDNFARSWQRAAGFVEVAPVRQSFRYADDDEEDEDEEDDGEDGFGRAAVQASPKTRRSLLRAALEEEWGGEADERPHDVFGEEAEPAETDDEPPSPTQPALRRKSSSRTPLLSHRVSEVHDDSIFAIEPSLASPFGGSYGTTWGSLSSRVTEPSVRHAARLYRRQQTKGIASPDQSREPLFVKQIADEDGKLVSVVVGQSTLPQTIFNSVNVLIGVGLLALPLAFRLAGWIPGLLFSVFAAASTCYTAKLLAKCLDVDNSLITFADLAYVSFGPWARVGTSVLFSLELVGACVALVVLFADSLHALVPEWWGVTEWKVVCGFILVPLGFVPLRWLSFTSILGIFSCAGIVLAVLVEGLLKADAPGSLRRPAETHWFPANWMTLPIAFGILMSPWGGHSVFPNIYRDMRHPFRYRRSVNITYTVTSTLDLFMAVIGLLMYGDGVADEITRNLLDSATTPHGLRVFLVLCVAIIPITKVPLNARPIVSTLELFLGLDPRALAASSALTGLSGSVRGVLKVLVRVGTMAGFVVLAVLVPSFDTIMSLLGATACFTVCIILPCAFHLKLFGERLSRGRRALDWGLIVVAVVLAAVSTGFNFVPRERMGL